MQRPVAADRQLAEHAVGDRLGEPIRTGGRVVGPVGPEQPLRSFLLDHPVQVVDGHAEFAHNRDGRGVVPPHVGLGPVEVRASFRVPVVQDRGRVGEHQCGVGPLADPGDDPAEVLRVAIHLDLMTPVLLGPLQVVQAAVQVHDVGLLFEDPLVEVREHVRAVPAVRRRTDDDRLPREPLGNLGRVAQPDRVADEHHSRELGIRRGVRLASGVESRRQQTDERKKNRRAGSHRTPSGVVSPSIPGLLVDHVQ